MNKNISFTIGQKIKIKIEKIVFGGESIGKVNDFTFFVPMGVPGDLLEIEIISLKKSYGRGLIKNIIEASKDRIEDISKISFEDFDGCDFGMLTYEKQLYYKNEMLIDVLKKIGNIDVNKVSFEQIIPSSIQKNYRNKTAEPFFKKNGKIMTGFYSKKSHNIFVPKESLLKSKVSEEIINKFLNEINTFQNTNKEFNVYNEVNNSGFLKHIIVRNNEKNDVLLTIVVNKNSQIKQLKKVLEKIYNENECIKSVYISKKNYNDNVILGDENILLFGSEYLEEEINNIKFKIYPNSFFQINKKQSITLYNKAIEFFGEIKNKTVIDAFSGTGTIAMIMSKAAKKVIGIESTENSVKAAQITSDENKITNVTFINDKVENSISKILKFENIEGIIFDPPRKGIDKIALNSVIENNISKIVYISCNPSTFARDCKILIENGYTLQKITSVDMFPQTNHIEVVGLLIKNN